jgi:arsenate reductase-like glutaredoxin family protein
VDFE